MTVITELGDAYNVAITMLSQRTSCGWYAVVVNLDLEEGVNAHKPQHVRRTENDLELLVHAFCLV